LTLPEIIDEIKRNAERTHMLGDYLQQIKPEDLHIHRELVVELGNFDDLIYKLTGKTIIDLAEKSRIWCVSIDNGRSRARSMNRYLSLDKLPSNPR